MTTTGNTRPTYRERREARAARLREWATKREQRAEQAAGSVDAITSIIPPGQPILLGHHSQKRAERDQARIQRGMRNLIDHSDKAREFSGRADNIESAAEHAIYSDDADAIPRLRERIAELESERATIKAHNAACRKGTADPATLPPRLARELASSIRVWGKESRQCAGGRFPSYFLTNLGGNINRNKKRLAELERRAANS
jgi:hypothetical protein